MQEIKELLKQAGCTKEEIEVAAQAITNINGDHIEIYRHINALCKAQGDLAHTKSLIRQLGFNEEPRQRVRKRKPTSEKSLLDKSGVNAASESLREQREPSAAVVAVDELLGDKGRAALGVKPVTKPKRKKETDAEIKKNIEGPTDELTGAVRLSPEEAANNLTIDL